LGIVRGIRGVAIARLSTLCTCCGGVAINSIAAGTDDFIVCLAASPSLSKSQLLHAKILQCLGVFLTEDMLTRNRA
jgi:hypothetical protein